MADYKAESVSLNSDIEETIIGSKTSFKGNVTTDKPIRIEGTFEGSIESEDLVVVSPQGSFDGTMTCRELQIAGNVKGDIKCSEKLVFVGAGSFKGDVVTRSAVIGEDALYDGSLKIVK